LFSFSFSLNRYYPANNGYGDPSTSGYYYPYPSHQTNQYAGGGGGAQYYSPPPPPSERSAAPLPQAVQVVQGEGEGGATAESGKSAGEEGAGSGKDEAAAETDPPPAARDDATEGA